MQTLPDNSSWGNSNFIPILPSLNSRRRNQMLAPNSASAAARMLSLELLLLAWILHTMEVDRFFVL
ncbi:MAG: hypothetical protein ACOVQM_12105, partial [Pirellula sp.]